MTSVSSIGSDVNAALSQTDTTNSAESLDYDSFLRLFVAQLENQAPLNPVEGTEYTTQLAQFSSLEQSISTNEKLDGLISQMSLSQAGTLIGRTASNADGSISGVIDTVTILSDGTTANLANGQRLTLGAGITIE